jgi:hypothetical protein
MGNVRGGETYAISCENSINKAFRLLFREKLYPQSGSEPVSSILGLLFQDLYPPRWLGANALFGLISSSVVTKCLIFTKQCL